MKPVELVERAVENSSKGDDIVLDPFLGSGTTLIACEKLQRACRGLELDPHYCDVIVQRYVNWCAKNERESIVLRNGAPDDTFQPIEATA
jgi:DNA modification methylase